MAKNRGTWIWLSVALIVAVLALAWPSLEQQLRSSGVPCPWPFTLFHTAHSGGGHEPVSDTALPTFTLETLKKCGWLRCEGDWSPTESGWRVAFTNTWLRLRRYDGSDESLPILLAVGGKVTTDDVCEHVYN